MLLIEKLENFQREDVMDEQDTIYSRPSRQKAEALFARRAKALRENLRRRRQQHKMHKIK